MNTELLHAIARDEWVKRFKDRIAQQLGLSGDDDSIQSAELESWPEQDENPVAGFEADWRYEAPEAAADQNLDSWKE